MNPFPPPAGSQTFSTKPLQVGQEHPTMPMQIPQGGGGDFGPLPPGSNAVPIGQPGANQSSIVNGRLVFGNGQAAPNLMDFQRPTITDPNIDQSVRNSAIGDGYSGERGGFLYGGGQRLMPSTGDPAQDQATLYQFGVRTPQNAAAYGAAGGSLVPNGPAPSGAGAGGFQGGIDALRAGGPSPGMGQSIQDMRYQIGGGGGFGAGGGQQISNPWGAIDSARSGVAALNPQPQGFGGNISNVGQTPLPAPTEYNSLAPSTQAYMRPPQNGASMPMGGMDISPPPMGGGRSPLAQGGENRNRMIEALMRQYGNRR